MEKPFDLSNISPSSRYGRDYNGPMPSDADMPPSAGPIEYYPPPHLLNKDELRRNTWGGAGSGAMSPTSELMANLQVSCDSEDDPDKSKRRDDTSVAITTARIFRGIVVDRNGLITAQNARATRSRKGSDASSKTKQGEKSRQAAKIDKAKDLIDDAAAGAGTSGGSDENDPSKMTALYVMGEYEELNDLVRDGAKKLRENKSMPDESFFSLNRPRPTPAYMIAPPPPASTRSNTGMTSNSPSPMATSHISTSAPTTPVPAMSSPSGRKRVGSGSGQVSDSNTASKSRSRYKQVPRSAPPKLKQGSGTRDSQSHRSRGGGGSGGRAESDRRSHPSSHQRHSTSSRHQSSSSRMRGVEYNDPSDNWGSASSSVQDTDPGKPQQPHYFRDSQCNIFPGSDWTDALGFSVNSLWNCGANNGQMSPTSNPSSPRSPSYHSSHMDGGGGGGGRGYQSGYHYGHNHHTGYEERNPGQAYGYDGRSRNGGIRDTVVM